MQSGRILRRFLAEDRREVILRTPKWEDLDDMVDFINSLVEEKADIIRTEKVTREAETDWLAGVLIRLERGEELYIMAEVGGRVVANSEISKGGGYQKHVGGIGIGIRRGYRNIGIGTEMMKALIDQGRQWCLQVPTLRVFASNERAIHVYERDGSHRLAASRRNFSKVASI